MSVKEAGLSPRRRGNRAVGALRRGDGGPIPAQAGGPAIAPLAPGGAHGLSPRRRGNPLHLSRRKLPRGPISAQAGEPVAVNRRRDLDKAYPRAGGGTAVKAASTQFDKGLSPRRRGNLGRIGPAPLAVGPIPAQAGEPNGISATMDAPRAYPRAGGGTLEVDVEPVPAMGLSPRRRGNQFFGRWRIFRKGPIPAQAGEPLGTS